jgi:hypothetical protein
LTSLCQDGTTIPLLQNLYRFLMESVADRQSLGRHESDLVCAAIISDKTEHYVISDPVEVDSVNDELNWVEHGVTSLSKTM